MKPCRGRMREKTVGKFQLSFFNLKIIYLFYSELIGLKSQIRYHFHMVFVQNAKLSRVDLRKSGKWRRRNGRKRNSE